MFEDFRAENDFHALMHYFGACGLGSSFNGFISCKFLNKTIPIPYHLEQVKINSDSVSQINTYKQIFNWILLPPIHGKRGVF